MFPYIPFCRRSVRLCIFLIILVISFAIVRHRPLFSFLPFQTNPYLVTTVPNTVHFFHFIDKQQPDRRGDIKDVQDLSFISATCILAAAFNQEPERILIHTNNNVTFNLANKKYWSLVFRVLGPKIQKKKNVKTKITPKTILKVVHLKEPTHVFGQPLSSVFHAADVARINVLIREGGIALDQDTFIVRKLDPSFFHQGMKVTLGMITS